MIDPRFVDTAYHDYHLLPDSPCIGAGRYGRDCGALPYVSSAINNINIPDDFTLIETYPNPFNNAVKIEFNLIKTALVKIDIYNLVGQMVKSLRNEYIYSGSHSLVFIPEKELSSGTYLIRFSVDNRVSYKKVTYLK